MDSTSQALAAAAQCQQTGNLAEAERLCREILARDPNSAEAHFQWGIVQRKQGQFERAAASFERAVALEPARFEAHYNLANTWKDLGRFEAAERSYREAIRLRPGFLMALSNLGNVLRAQGRHEEALEPLRQAIALEPNCTPVYLSLGTALRELGRLDEAAAYFAQAVAIEPQLAEAHNTLGVILQALGRFDEATACYERAVRLDPQMAEAHNNLGTTLQELGRFESAERSCREAVRLRPDFADAQNNLGRALHALGRFDAAIACYGQALRLDPQLVIAHTNLGRALHMTGRLDEALDNYDEAIRLKPDYAEAHRHRALLLLSRGDFETGWAEYEWRLKCQDYGGPALREPRWDGSPLGDRTLLVHTEQGLGDVFQFIRYVRLLRQQGNRVLLAVPHSLVPLLTASGYENLIASGSAFPKFDLHAPLLSLPHILGTTLDTIPNQVPYLAADPMLIEHWRRRLATIDGFKIGIAWQGNPKYLFDRFRSIPLIDFWPLAKVPGVRLVSLQRGLGTEQIDAAAEQVPLVELGPELDREAGAFMDTAAVIKNLDLVIAPDTATVHLAGALGVPTWLPVCCYPEWRWMRDRDDSPWYPTMRLFRQHTLNKWQDVFPRMAVVASRLAGG